MDPLSVSASIIGITTAAFQVSQLLKNFLESSLQASSTARAVLNEVTGIQFCLHQLQDFLLGHGDTGRSRRSLILIEQVIVIFTDCVSLFSELEQVLEGLKGGEHLGVIDRVKWMAKESTISKILTRLQASKSSLNMMLVISNCTSLDRAEVSMRNLTTLVQEVLHKNIKMASRLKNLEKMYPRLIQSRSVSRAERRLSDQSDLRSASRGPGLRFAFEEELETSTVYRHALLRQIRASDADTSSKGLSWFSGISLSDISDVSAIALPIYPMELWNHRHYTVGNKGSEKTSTSLETWYNPDKERSAFIRTAYFNGQYTNQYAQSKFSGHLVYRRFTVSNPNSAPVFTEGVPLRHALEKIQEEEPVMKLPYELEAAPTKQPPKMTKFNGFAAVIRKIGPQESVGPEQHSSADEPIEQVIEVDQGQPFQTAKRPLNSPTSPPPPLKRKAKQPYLRGDQHEHLSGQLKDAESEPQDFIQAFDTYWPLPMHSPDTKPSQLPPVPYSKNSGTSRPCSFLCEEEECVFPTRGWTKPLAGMGNAEGWCRETLGRFEDIAY